MKLSGKRLEGVEERRLVKIIEKVRQGSMSFISNPIYMGNISNSMEIYMGPPAPENPGFYAIGLSIHIVNRSSL